MAQLRWREADRWIPGPVHRRLLFAERQGPSDHPFLQGKDVVFVDLKATMMFGEIAAIDRGPRSASIEALEPCLIASLSSDAFEKLMLREPSVAIAALSHMAAEVRRLSERVFEFSTLVVQNRIQAELLRLAGGAGERHGEALLSPAPSLSDIADRISTHREAV